MADKSDFATRRAASREKHGPELRDIFKQVGKDKLNKRSMGDFQASMKHYLDNFNYDKTKENELNQDEFVKFWADLYALFEKIDKDGDGEIAVVECVSLLDDKAEKFGLSKGDLYKRVVHFFNMADTDGDRKISLVEFFIQLPKLEEFLLNKKLQMEKEKK